MAAAQLAYLSESKFKCDPHTGLPFLCFALTWYDHSQHSLRFILAPRSNKTSSFCSIHFTSQRPINVKYLPNHLKQQSNIGQKDDHHNITRFPVSTFITRQAKTGIKTTLPTTSKHHQHPPTLGQIHSAPHSKHPRQTKRLSTHPDATHTHPASHPSAYVPRRHPY